MSLPYTEMGSQLAKFLKRSIISTNFSSDSLCATCEAQMEDDFHALIKCPVGRQVWLLSSLGFFFDEINFVTVGDWLKEITFILDRISLVMALTIL